MCSPVWYLSSPSYYSNISSLQNLLWVLPPPWSSLTTHISLICHFSELQGSTYLTEKCNPFLFLEFLLLCYVPTRLLIPKRGGGVGWYLSLHLQVCTEALWLSEYNTCVRGREFSNTSSQMLQWLTSYHHCKSLMLRHTANLLDTLVSFLYHFSCKSHSLSCPELIFWSM